MTLFIIGALLLAFILALFWLKDELENPLLARIAYSELTMRLTVIAAAMMIIGIIMAVADLFN